MVLFKMTDEVESLDYILRMGDRGRVNLPSKTVKMYGIKVGSLVELTYVKVENVLGKTLLPFRESNNVDCQKRFQSSRNARNYLGLKQGDYFVAHVRNVSNPTKSQVS